MPTELSLKDRIVRFLKHKYQEDPESYVHGGEIEREALIAGYSASNASRRLRELANEQVLDKTENLKGHVMYRFKHD